jgi:hypothetical protein
VLLGSAATIRGEPLDRRQVSAEANWLVHIDFDMVASGKAAQKIRDDWLTADAVKESLQQVREMFGLDPTRDLAGVTFYGNGRLPYFNGVVLVRTKVDARRVVARLNQRLDHQSNSYAGHEVYIWPQEDQKRAKNVIGCVCGPQTIVFSKHAQAVRLALEVLDGKSPSLSGSNLPLAGEAPAGTVLQAGGVAAARAFIPLMSPVVRQSESLWLAVGERDGVAFGQARLVARSSQVAAQIRAALEGVVAMARLDADTDHDPLQWRDWQEAATARSQADSSRLLVKLLDGIQVTQADCTVNVQWRVPSDDLLKLIEMHSGWNRRSRGR